ncbi:MAG: hypothetical protein FJ271_32030 [Planctomycetes bacterium]|nr:hypothetical protein [Planctomycetota bacterium]
MRSSRDEKLLHKWLIPALTEWAVILLLLTAGFTLNHWLIWAVVVVLVGSRQHALGVLGHDGAHFTAARSRTVNDLATQLLCFWPLGCGLGGFRRFHFAHHRHFGTDKDPELLFKNDWSKEQWTLPTTRAQIVRYFLLDLVGFGLPEVLKAFRLLGRVGIWDWIGPALLWASVGAVLHATGLWFAAIIWVLALVTSFWGFFRLRTWTEHVGTPTTHRVQANWWQRLFITPHGSWSHYEHHEHPAVPFWRRSELRVQGDRTVTMGELFRSFGTTAPAGAAPETAISERRSFVRAASASSLHEVHGSAGALPSLLADKFTIASPADKPSKQPLPRQQSVPAKSKAQPTGREIRAHIPDDARKRSTIMGLAIFLVNFLMYGLTLAGILASPWWIVKLCCAAVNGLFIAHLLSIGHDAGHNTLTRYAWLNGLLGRLAMLPSLYPFSVWRVTHDRAHHDFTNLKGKDFIWVPLSMEEYSRLSAFGRLLQRLYRTVPGVALYYLIELWLKNAFGKNKQMTGRGLNDVIARLDRLLVIGFPLLLGWTLCTAQPAMALAWGVPQLAVSSVLVLAVLVPFLVHCWLTGLLTFLHHTHPQIKWYADRREWSFFGGALQGTTHVIGPWPWGILLPNLTEHNAHHVDPKVPLYNLPRTQKLLEEAYPEVIVQEFSFTAFRRLLTTCQLYDYDAHRWHSFSGTPTGPRLVRGRSVLPGAAESSRRVPA